MKSKITFFYLIFFIIIIFFVKVVLLHYFDMPGIKIAQKEIYISKYIPRNEIDYLVLGDSATLYQISPVSFGNYSFSAAQIAAPVYLLKKYYDQMNIKVIKKGVIIGVTFIDNHYNKDIWKIIAPNNLLALDEIEQMFCLYEKCNFFKKTQFKMKYFQSKYLLDDDIWSTLSFGIKLQNFSHLKNYNERILLHYRRNHGSYAANKGWIASGSDFYAPYRESFSKRSTPPKSEIILLQNFVNELTSKGINVYLVLPYYYRLNRNLNLKDYESNYDQLISKLKSPLLKIVNTRQSKFDLELKFFSDFNHLNEEGAVIFSKKIIDEIRSMEGKSK